MIFDIPIKTLLGITVYSLIEVFFQPFFYMVVFIVYWQCRSLRDRQRYLFGYDNMSLQKTVFQFTVAGILGGLFAGMVVLITGLSINNIGFHYLWPLAIFLLFVNARFLCFAYAGGLLALSSILFGWPNISAVHLLALVAILHATESLLVFIGGKYSALPMYFELNGKAVGGFLLTNFWPLPFILLFAVAMPENVMADYFKMPDWWPLFPAPDKDIATEYMYVPMSVVGILGYSSVAITCNPLKKRRISALVLFIYSLLLFALVYFSIGNIYLIIFAALFSILGHEAVVYIDQYLEKKGQPIFVGTTEKFVVFSTIFDSPADRAGIKSLDVILKLNGNRIYDEQDIILVSRFLPPKFNVEVLRNNKEITLEMQFQEDEKKVLGFIRMPVKQDNLLEVSTNYSIFLKLYRKYFKKRI